MTLRFLFVCFDFTRGDEVREFGVDAEVNAEVNVGFDAVVDAVVDAIVHAVHAI